MILPVRVSVSGVTYLAHTVDLAEIGVRLGGLHVPLRAGDIVTLKRGQQKATFRVVRTQQLEANEQQAGIEALEPDSKFWGVDVSTQQSAPNTKEQKLLRMLFSYR